VLWWAAANTLARAQRWGALASVQLRARDVRLDVTLRVVPSYSMNPTPRREHWDGHPVELGDAWILRKGKKVARCVLVSHELGWELRLMTTDLLRSQVCKSTE
jgi:hypothetical protein